MKSEKLYHVYSIQTGGWVLVTEKPVPRSEAVMAVAAQWALDRKARAIPQTNP